MLNTLSNLNAYHELIDTLLADNFTALRFQDFIHGLQQVQRGLPEPDPIILIKNFSNLLT